MSLLPYKENITATNEITTTSTDFTFGGAALQNDFIIFEPGTYLIGIGYRWDNQRIQDLHRVRIMIDDVEFEALSVNHSLGGVNVSVESRPVIERAVPRDFTVGTFDIKMEFSTFHHYLRGGYF